MTVVMLLAGCASGPSIDWKARVGTYTYDQAVKELGTPDNTATLSDASKVAEWQVRSEGPSVVDSGSPYSNPGLYGTPSGGRPGFETVYPAGPNSGKWLRLTFGADGRLREGKYYHR